MQTKECNDHLEQDVEYICVFCRAQKCCWNLNKGEKERIKP